MDTIIFTNNQVILGVKAGRGFGFLGKSFIIEGSLNGHVLETDLIQPANEISIGAELLWEAEKSVLKRLRTGNVPLKLECFSVLNGKKQERVGYILLTLRAAKIVPQDSGLLNVPGTWHSLLGVKTDVKSYCPSLLLSLCIEDPSITNSYLTLKENTNNTNVSGSDDIQTLSLNNDTIQVGPHKSTANIFLLTIIIDSATDLSLLAESDLETSGIFTFFCFIMGCRRQGGTISHLSSFTVDIENKFTVKLSSSLKSLRNYFQERKLASIKITTNTQEIAFGEISGSCLIPTDNLEAFQSQYSTNNTLTMRSRCYLMKSSTRQIPVSSTGLRPYVNTMITLQYLCCDTNKGLGDGDAEKYSVLYSSHEIIKPCANITWNLKNTNLFKTGLREEHTNMQEWFTLNITVESVLVHKISSVDKFFLRFRQANSITMLKHHQEVMIDKANQLIPVQGVACSLFLQGSLEWVQEELVTHKPSVELLAIVDRDCSSFAQGDLDINLLHKDEMECCCEVNLKDTSQNREFGVMKVKMILEKVMILSREKNLKIPILESNIVPSLDAHATEKATKEIEEWKKQQKELFMIELKKKELEHLDAVVEDWENRQKEYETALNNNVQHCTELASSLSHATDELRSKSQIIAQKEIELSQIQTALEAEYQAKLKECREASRRMEDDFRLEIARLQRENKSLLDQIALQEEENACIVKVQKDLENELERLKKNSLTEDQTATLLKELKLAEEKNEMAYRSKIFFKEQWARAMREIHIIKSRHREEMNVQIKSNKEELKSLGRMLPPCESSHHLHISTSRHSVANTASLLETTETGSNPELDSLLSSSQRSLSICMDKEDTNDALQKSTVEHKLQELVQERDSLLNTGTYALDHVLITKLNKQIRLLLAESNHKFV